MTKGRNLALAPMRRLLQQAGADRVSDNAALALGEVLEEIGVDVASRALTLARHAGRKTITREDIRLAAKT